MSAHMQAPTRSAELWEKSVAAIFLRGEETFSIFFTMCAGVGFTSAVNCMLEVCRLILQGSHGAALHFECNMNTR